MQVDQRQPGSSTNLDAFTLPSLTTSTRALVEFLPRQRQKSFLHKDLS